MVKIPHFHCRGRQFNPWLGKLYVPEGATKKKKKQGISLQILGTLKSCKKMFMTNFMTKNLTTSVKQAREFPVDAVARTRCG